MKEFDRKLGAILRSRREQKDYSQEYIADRLGVSKNAVSHWELGKRSMYAETLKEYCQLLGCTMQEVFDELEGLSL